MSKTSTRQPLSRRDFLKLFAAAGVTAAGVYALYTYAPWINYEEQAQKNQKPLEKSSTTSIQMRELVRYATLAANGHNTQPWKFVVRQNAMEIHPDSSRRLPIVDPNDRELWISLGCALENLLISARTVGYYPEVTYPEEKDFIRVDLTTDTSLSTPLFDAIPLRQNTRSEYNGQPIKAADLDQIQSLPLESGVSLNFVTNSANVETVLEYLNQGNLSQYANNAFLDELISWLRFNKNEVMASADGLYTRCSGNPEVPRWLGQMFVSGTKPQQQADADAKKLRSSAGVVIIASKSDSKADWVRTGQVYERMALQMTSLNIKSALHNQPIEVTAVREQFQQAMGLGNALPQLLLRFGYADPMPRSIRRPVEQVLVQS